MKTPEKGESMQQKFIKKTAFFVMVFDGLEKDKDGAYGPFKTKKTAQRALTRRGWRSVSGKYTLWKIAAVYSFAEVKKIRMVTAHRPKDLRKNIIRDQTNERKTV